MDLRVEPCRSLCDWSAAPRGALFACRGCGSQWEPGQRWTPRQSDGAVPPAVRAARDAADAARHDAARDDAARAARAVSAVSGGAAGSEGS